MREAIYIPVIHTLADMGTMAESLRMEYIVKYGKKRWEQHIKAIDDMWGGLCKKLFKLKLPYKKVRIYQNSLPVCGKELEMVHEMATKGSPNYKIIIELVGKGAKLEGTEDPKLLMEEYNNLKMLFEAAGPAEKIKAMENYRRMARGIIIKRDKFIAGRIDNTLVDKEFGIVFMGVGHTVDKYLANIKISYLIHRLPFRESYDIIKGKQSIEVSFIATRAKEELSSITGLETSTVLGIEGEGGGWRVTLEMVEKRSIPDSMDILGTYEAHLDEEGHLLDFIRILLRKRGNTGE